MFCGPAFPLAHCLPSTPSAGGRRPPLGSVGFAWLFPAFPPSCPFSSAMVRVSVPFRSLFGSFVGTTQQSDPLLRASMARVLGLPIAALGATASGGVQGLPVLAHGASTHARGLGVRPRQVLQHLAILGASGVAFGSRNSLGTWKFNSISRLNTRPACAPVNASDTASRSCPHDSGSSRVASPSMCESLLRYTMPVYPGASSGTSPVGRRPSGPSLSNGPAP